jgi:Lrp/AsnC family transcriptional regulator of ectoine degradation
MAEAPLDAFDIRILAALQTHGRLSKNRLAEIVGLSATPCWARLQRLTARGLVRGYHADIALERIRDVTQVVVTVSLAQHRKTDFSRFEARIRETSEIVDCVATGGGIDYVLRIVCASLADFQTLMDALLDAELGIDRYLTYIVTRQVKRARPDLARVAGKAGA